MNSIVGEYAFSGHSGRADTWSGKPIQVGSSIDFVPHLPHNSCMSIDTAISSETLARMQQAADQAAKGIRDPVKMREAFGEMTRLREALRSRIGTVDWAVGLVRDARDQ